MDLITKQNFKMSYAQEFVTMKIAELKHKIKALQTLSEISGSNYEKEINQLLDELSQWLKIEEELKKH